MEDFVKEYFRKFEYAIISGMDRDEKYNDYYYMRIEKEWKGYKIEYIFYCDSSFRANITKYKFSFWRKGLEIFCSKVIDTEYYNQNQFEADFKDIRLFFNDFIRFGR